jgi:hypothetical protein
MGATAPRFLCFYVNDSMHGVTFLRRCVPVSMLLYELFYYRMVQFFNANLKLDRQNA